MWFYRSAREAAFLRPEARNMTDREDDLLSSLRGNVSNNAQSSIMFLLPSLLETHVRRYYKDSIS